MEPVQDLPSERHEWFGVTEVVNKVLEGRYRANATVIIMGLYFLAVEGIIRYEWGHGILNVPTLGEVVVILFILLLIYPIAFAFGYAGIVGGQRSGPFAPVGYATTNVTSSTDFAGAQEFLNGVPALGSFTYDMAKGRLAIDKTGLSGILSLKWDDLNSMTPLNIQTIRLERTHREFGISVGKKSTDIHFVNEKDAAGFVSAAKGYLKSS